MCSGLYFEFRNEMMCIGSKRRDAFFLCPNHCAGCYCCFFPVQFTIHRCFRIYFWWIVAILRMLSVTMPSIDKMRLCFCRNVSAHGSIHFKMMKRTQATQVYEVVIAEWMTISDFLSIWNSQAPINCFYRSVTFCWPRFFLHCYQTNFHSCLLVWECFDLSRSSGFLCVAKFPPKQSDRS